MKKTALLLILGLSSIFSLSAFAHEGHDHDAPTGVAAPKGGIIKSLENVHIEVVGRGKELKIYFYNQDMKPEAIKSYTVTAMTQLPRTKKQVSLPLISKDTHFEGTYDANNTHRYTLILTIKDPKEVHSDKLTYTIEPKK